VVGSRSSMPKSTATAPGKKKAKSMPKGMLNGKITPATSKPNPFAKAGSQAPMGPSGGGNGSMPFKKGGRVGKGKC